jgi:phosphatidylserine/phosphatidylglycerophosphate/cardiolipin synthase-like enzyme
MVVRVADDRYAFCGGVDISPGRTRFAWGRSPIWHDLHVLVQGPIARDIEKEFVLRWNRETLDNIWNVAAIKHQLRLPPGLKPSDRDNRAELQQSPVQMLRTVADNAWTTYSDTKRNDIKRVYKNLVHGAEDFLYFENQFFRSLDLAGWIADRAKKNPKLKAIFVVLENPAEGDDAITMHGKYLQYTFFERVSKAMGNRVGIYTMSGRMVHSKFALADDARVIIGSANANERSFTLDSEIALAIEDAALARQWRLRAWNHAVGPAGADPSAKSDAFLGQWAAVAAANTRLPLDQMAGEGVVPFDWRALPGKRNGDIPDDLAMMDFDARGEIAEPGVAYA